MTASNRENPWKRISSREIYQNPWIKVREDQVITPGGKPGIYGVIETHPAIGVVAMNDQREIYLVGQYRYPTSEYSWEIVEGAGEKGESNIETARRELQEETGLTAAQIRTLGREVHLSNSFTDEKAYFFLATGLTQGEATPEDCEQLEVRKVSVDTAFDMVHSGEIKDSMSVIALMFLEHELKQIR